MIELPFIFVTGLLGSAHCLGMCGPLAIALSSGVPEGSSLFRRQVIFSCGRIVTYGFMGAAVGFGGIWLATSSRGLILTQAWLALIAGAVLILMGLVTVGWIPKPATRILSGIPCGAAGWLKTFLTAEGWYGPLLAGVFTGFIPCGLVYAFLCKAAAAGSVLLGWATMAAFGLGTIPMMVLAGYSGRIFSSKYRSRIFQFAAWCVVITGVISVVRGASQLQTRSLETAAPCPFCDEANPQQ